MRTLVTTLAVVLALAWNVAPAHAQIGQDGWTIFTASPDTRIIYVSSAVGDDSAHSGLSPSEPKRTLAAGAALLRDGYPDWLLLKSGETWTEVFPSWYKGGRSASEPMRIGVYGGLERATLQCGAERGFVGLIPGPVPKSHLAITDIALITEGGYPPSGEDFSQEGGIEFLGSWTDILLENVLIQGFLTNLVFQSNRELQVMQDIRVRRCVIVDAYTVHNYHAQGAYLAGVDRLLLEECVFDHNGWNEANPAAVPTMYRHNIYIQGHDGNFDDCTNVTVRGLTSGRAAATGMQQRPGGLCEQNLFLHNPLNVVFGTTGGLVSDCVVVGSRDINTSLPRGVGFNLVQGTEPRRAVRCIAVGQPSPMGTANVYGYAIENAPNVVLENCVAWQWKDAGGSGSAVNAAGSPFPTIIGGNLEQTPPAYVVSVENYMASLGGIPSVQAYMDECRLQSRANWRPQYTAAAFNTWARAAFGIVTPPLCYANCDGSTVAPVVNIADFTCFLTRFASGDPGANCDNSTVAPTLNFGDFTCFLTKVAIGCP